MRVTVLMGGTSSERDVSLASGLRVAGALRAAGHDVRVVDTARGTLSAGDEQAMLEGGRVVKTVPPDVQALVRLNRALPATLDHLAETDVIFLALHGGTGEDGTIQALLDLTGIPYTGSGHLASALAMDKDLSKHLFRSAGVPTADWLMAPATVNDVTARLGFPVIVKPSKQGSTVGLSLVKDPAELQGAIEEAFRHDDEVMIEAFVPGRELTVGILGGEALPVGEIIPVKELYDYECKYTPGMAQEIFPAALTPEQTAAVQQLAKRAFGALKLGGCARIDFRMTPSGDFFCLEANTLPGMTETSLIPQAAAAAGVSFPALCDRIVRLAASGPTPVRSST
jgi:D-alanine-D-alanine ligase